MMLQRSLWQYSNTYSQTDKVILKWNHTQQVLNFNINVFTSFKTISFEFMHYKHMSFIDKQYNVKTSKANAAASKILWVFSERYFTNFVNDTLGGVALTASLLRAPDRCRAGRFSVYHTTNQSWRLGIGWFQWILKKHNLNVLCTFT